MPVAVACDSTASPGAKRRSGKPPTRSSTSLGVMIAIGAPLLRVPLPLAWTGRRPRRMAPAPAVTI